MLLFAFDTKGHPVNITGHTATEILAGADSHLEFGRDETGALLNVVKTVRTGIRHDWDTDIHTVARVAYFVISSLTDDRGDLEAYVTPMGQRAMVEAKQFFPKTWYVTDVTKAGTLGGCRHGGRGEQSRRNGWYWSAN